MIPHEAICASAGSGKTYQLAHRFIALLARGAPPERIAALTFSRKAAGEILESIAQRLCRAASDPRDAAAVARQAELPASSGEPAIFRGLLRAFVRAMPRLQIGTLDSFMVGVLRAFPFELGLAGPVEVGDAMSPEAATLREEALDRILQAGSGARERRSVFMEAFKAAAFGREEKRLDRLLGDFLENGRDRYRVLPRAEGWGRPERIWPAGNPWLEIIPDAEETAAAARGLLAGAGFPERFRTALETLIDQAGAYGDTGRWDRTGLDRSTIFQRLLDGMEALVQGDFEMVYSRKTYTLPAPLAAALHRLLVHLAGTEFRRAAIRTAGTFRMLQVYEHEYRSLMRRAGWLSFNDAHVLLGDGEAHGPRLSQVPERSGLLQIDYRLDGRIDHWLLDEFQDTSDLQWAALANLADEVLQDTGGTRSFFFVGDPKQSIYAWRGGNPRLFGSLLERYGPVLRRRRLDRSYRSCQAVIDTVNRVFDFQDLDDFPAAASKAWNDLWSPHSCAAGVVPEHGCALLLEPDGGTETRPGEEERYALAAALARDINPPGKGLTAAFLTRDNQAASELTDALRRLCPGLPVVEEGRRTLMDHPVTGVLYSLLRFCAHPGDLLSWRHVQMSPLGRLASLRAAPREELVLPWLRRIQTDGFLAFLRDWMPAFEPLDPYGRRRLEELFTLAGLADAGSKRSIDAFLRRLETHTVRDTGGADTLRVMTIHQAKGLGFDIVVLADLMDPGFDRARRLEWLEGCEPEGDVPRWFLRAPPRALADRDAVLREVTARHDAESALASLCLYYVALTRARHGLYLITTPAGKTSRAWTAARFLKQRLLDSSGPDEGRPGNIAGMPVSILYQAGDPAWHRDFPVAVKPPAAPPPGLPPWSPGEPERLERVEPSRRPARTRPEGSVRFSSAARRARAVGAAVHELLRRVEWIGQTGGEAMLRAWRSTSAYPAAVCDEAGAQFLRLLEAPEARRELERPDGNAELWREQPFEAVIEGRWVSGIFDRVTLVRDDRGAVQGAVLLDYKSRGPRAGGRDAPSVEPYRDQIEWYRAALSLLTGLPVSSLEARILFTDCARVLPLPPQAI